MKFTDNYFMNYDIMAFTESFIDLDVPFTPDIADDKPVLEMTRFVKVTTFGLVITSFNNQRSPFSTQRSNRK